MADTDATDREIADLLHALRDLEVDLEELRSTPRARTSLAIAQLHKTRCTLLAALGKARAHAERVAAARAVTERGAAARAARVARAPVVLDGAQ